MSKKTHLTIMSTSGKVKKIDISKGSIDINDIMELTNGDLNHKVFVVPERSPNHPAPKSNASFPADYTEEAPPIPQPATSSSVLPERSSYLTISTTPYYKTGDFESNGNVPMNVVGSGATIPAFNKSEKQDSYVEPEFPTQQITLKRYWLNTFSVTVTGPQDFSKELTNTQGMSESEMTTMSAELGVSVDYLSAKVSASTSTTTTISESTEITDTYSFTVDRGEIGIWTLWQLVDAYFFVDGDGEIITWTGKAFLDVGISELKFSNMALMNTFEDQLEIYAADLVLFPNTNQSGVET